MTIQEPKEKLYYVSNSHEKIYMEIRAKRYQEAGEIFTKETGKGWTIIYHKENWIRSCGKTQAEFWEWKKVEQKGGENK